MGYYIKIPRSIATGVTREGYIKRADDKGALIVKNVKQGEYVKMKLAKSVRGSERQSAVYGAIKLVKK